MEMDFWPYLSLILLLLWDICPITSGTKLSPITNDLFGSKVTGVLAAFGDLNADKLVDIFLLDQTGKMICACVNMSMSVCD